MESKAPRDACKEQQAALGMQALLRFIQDCEHVALAQQVEHIGRHETIHRAWCDHDLLRVTTRQELYLRSIAEHIEPFSRALHHSGALIDTTPPYMRLLPKHELSQFALTAPIVNNSGGV